MKPASHGGSRKSNAHAEKQAATWLVPEQVDRLARFARRGRYNSLAERDHALVELLYDTGLRVSEAVALDVDMFRFEASPPELFLPGGIQKGTQRSYTLDLSPGTASTLEAYLDRRPWDVAAVFPSRQGDRAHANTLRRAVTAAAERAELEPYLGGTDATGRGNPQDVTPHTLRHSVAYRMLREEDARMVDVRDRLRHSSLRTTEEVYEHFKRR